MADAVTLITENREYSQAGKPDLWTGQYVDKGKYDTAAEKRILPVRLNAQHYDRRSERTNADNEELQSITDSGEAERPADANEQISKYLCVERFPSKQGVLIRPFDLCKAGGRTSYVDKACKLSVWRTP